MVSDELAELLNYKAEQYNNAGFISDDPISIPHRFSSKHDIEVSAFLTAVISWGQRQTIINNANRLMDLMDQSPHDFVLNHNPRDLKRFNSFVHRTFNPVDCIFFIKSLQNIIKIYGSLEVPFYEPMENGGSLYNGIIHFRDQFFGILHPARTLKHLPNIENGSTGKRINMFLRWMVRKDKRGVDFGIWNRLQPSQLYLPLDVHTANASKKLGLLSRKTHDWKAVLEITHELRKLSPDDPIKYDFALFGLSRFDGI